MNEQSAWKPTERWKAPSGFGLAVERDGQLGYAKTEFLSKEKLAACLAKLVGAPVPSVDIDSVSGVGRCAVSYVKNPHSRPLGDPHIEHDHSEQEKKALLAASGLLAFLAWIDAADHGSEANYVVEQDCAGGEMRIVAIDFEHAFSWETGTEKISISSQRVIQNPDPQRVREILCRIEGLPSEQIERCCGEASLPDLAPILIQRQRLLRAAFRAEGLSV